MFLISNPAMIIASAEAGILGSMPSLNGRSHEDFRAMLREITDATNAPFAINLTIGLTDESRRKADLHACIDAGVKVLITSYGNPTEITREAHRHGMIVMHDVINLRHARKAQAAGVDAIIAVGAGAGGHGGTISPFALVPWLRDSLEVPIVAAGCISGGRQALAALSLGAELCYMGTRFIASTECGAIAEYKEMVERATPEDIVYTDEVSGIHANFLRDSLPEEGPRSRESPRKRWRDIWSAGQGVAQIHETRPLTEIVYQVMGEYHEALQEQRARSGSTEEASASSEMSLTRSPQVKIPLSVTPREAPESFNLTEILLDAHLEAGRGAQTALICPEGSWSYAELAHHVSAYAHRLTEMGIQPEERVLVAVRDSADFVGALLGALRIGAVGVMLNPDLEAERVAELMEYSRARAAFVERGETYAVYERALVRSEAQQPLRCQLIEVEGSQREARETYNQDEPILACADTHRDDPAIWLFSGGTTGRPKAIVQPHRSFLYTTERYGRGVMGYSAQDRTLSVPKLYFGYATGANLIFPLAAGGSSILFAEKPTPERLFDLIEAHRPTLLINVPTVINRMVNHPSASGRDLSSLRAVTSAGEALPQSLSEAWSALYDAPLCDGLGTAEMWHIFLTNHPSDPHRRRTGTLGQVIEGFEISLRDPDHEHLEVPEGSPGVMWVRGGARALGYWRLGEASQRAFRGAWYASGDLMIRDADGFYTFCGRSDDMIKVAGKFASPKEVEDCLMSYSMIEECAVVGRPDDTGLMKLFAFVTLKQTHHDGDVEEAKRDILGYLQIRLDSYKLPKRIEILSSFPKTHLGKINRGAL